MAKRPGSQLSLTNFFAKTKKLTNDEQPVASTSSSSASMVRSCLPVPKINHISTSQAEGNLKIDDTHTFDVGRYLHEDILDQETKLNLLKYPWIPEFSFEFPSSGKRNLKFQRQWLQRFSWLVYTKSDGALCKYCVLFTKDTAGKGGHQKLKSLVKEPYKNWKDALETFKKHEANEYHKEAMMMGTNLLSVSKDHNLDIRNLVDSGRKKQALENRKKLVSIVETIRFCGRQELPLRGSNDSGPLSTKMEEPSYNDGNFRALLRMRIQCGDKNLTNHTENISLNASYMSPTIQNDIIEICGEIIQKEIVKDVIEAEVFSILVDETADIAGYEQLSLCVRYTKKEGDHYVSKEDFLGFIRLQHTTGQDIAQAIISFLKKLNLPCSKMVGQGYDGAAVMKGTFKGVQAVIKNDYPEALYVHCCSHSLNLALSHSCQLQNIRNCVGTVKAIITFFKKSPKRIAIVQEKIKLDQSNFPWKTLTSMCETRWVENHNGLMKFKELYKPIISTLEYLSDDSDIETSTKASSFIKALLNGEFVICLCFLARVFSYTLPLCKILQSPLCDLKSATDHVQNISDLFQNLRNNIETEFTISYKTAKTILSDVDGEMKLPRLTPVQRNRCNIRTEDPEQYFRIAMAIPLLDDFINQLKVRFLDHKEVFGGLSSLLPSVCCNPATFLDIESLRLYQNRIDLDLLQSEFDLWKTFWVNRDMADRPSCAIEALGDCNKDFYPNIFTLLNIFSTLPVTTCTPERTFSTLRRLKTYLRNSCGQSRLSGLALMSVHRNKEISTDRVINEFASKKERRLDFVL